LLRISRSRGFCYIVRNFTLSYAICPHKSGKLIILATEALLIASLVPDFDKPKMERS